MIRAGALKTLFIFLFALAIFGCTRKWFLSIDDMAGGRLNLCFSSGPQCSGDGVQFNSLEFAEVDRTGTKVRTVWLIQGSSDKPQNYVIKHLVYGTVPSGWVEIKHAEPIRDNTFYSVDETYYVVRHADGKLLVFGREEFFKRGSLLREP